MNVFDSDFSKPHSVIENPVAMSEYGKFKIQCEEVVLELLKERAVIIRIPAIWGKNSLRFNVVKNFIQNGGEIEAYCNLKCNNLMDTLLAKQITYIIDHEKTGIFHLGSTDLITQGKFVQNLITRMANEEMKLPNTYFENQDEIYYFGLETNTKDLSEQLQCTSEVIIEELCK
ncbi:MULTISPECIES: sugar nucleotide-binding protein [Bacillus]|uniref:sugar nucleotide-binding protein n=1 Tax=Bacillus TaxID=1386 RepID=UPI000476EDC2